MAADDGARGNLRDVETCGANYNVEVVEAVVFGSDAFGLDAVDWEICEVDVGLSEGF